MRLYYRHKTDPVFADEPTEAALQGLGTYLLSTGSYKGALLVFKLNFRDYPSSLSAAIKVVRKAQSRKADDKGLEDLAKKLSELTQLK